MNLCFSLMSGSLVLLVSMISTSVFASSNKQKICAYAGPIASTNLKISRSSKLITPGFELTIMPCHEGVFGLVAKTHIEDRGRMDTIGAQFHLGVVGIELGVNHRTVSDTSSAHFLFFFGAPFTPSTQNVDDIRKNGRPPTKDWFFYVGPATDIGKSEIVNYLTFGLKFPIMGKIYTGRWGC